MIKKKKEKKNLANIIDCCCIEYIKYCKNNGINIVNHLNDDNLLNLLMDLMRNANKKVRKNAAILLSQMATYDQLLKEKIRSIGGIYALLQIQKEFNFGS